MTQIKPFLASIIFIIYSGCVSNKPTNTNADLVSQALSNPIQNHNIEVPSRFWHFKNFIIHFTTNMNENNKSLSPIIYVHGLGGNQNDFSEIINILHPSTHSRPYFAIDLPPFGKSLMNKSELSIQKYSNLLHEFVTLLPDFKISLVCHSMGGQVCIDFALNHPNQIELLTLIDPAGVYQRSTYINQTVNQFTQMNIGLKDYPRVNNLGDLTWYNQEFTNKIITNNPLVLMAIESYKDNFHDRIQNLKTKTVIIWGKNDVVFNFENGLYLKENIENSILYIIDDADHFSLKSHADIISKMIQTYL